MQISKHKFFYFAMVATASKPAGNRALPVWSHDTSCNKLNDKKAKGDTFPVNDMRRILLMMFD
jgi:hypothetical protein